MVNNQDLLVEEECILKKDEISELNKVFNFPSNFQVNVAPFGTPEGITVSSNVKNNDTDLLIVEKRINDSLKPLLLMSTSCSQRKEEKCHQGNKKLFKTRFPRKLAGLKGKLIALKDAVIPFRLYTRLTNKFHSQCLTLDNGDWDQSFPIPQEVKSEISHWCRCHTQERKQGNQNLVIPVVNNSIKHVIKSSRNFFLDSSSRSQPSHDNSDTENEQNEDESSNNVDVPTDYQLSDTLLGQYKHMVNNQGLLVEEECILKKDEISELNKVFNFPSNFQVNVAPFGTPEGITVSSNVKNNDTDLLIVEKRINDSLKPLLLMSSMLSSDSSNVDVELIIYLTQSAIVLAVNAQASLSRVRRNNIAKEIYGSEVLLPIKIKDTPKMFDETETERVRKLAKSIRKNNEAKQSLLKLNYHSKPNVKKSVNSSGNNTTGNSSNSKSSSGSNGRSNNFNGSPSNVASGSNNTKSVNGTNNRFQKNKK
ncbi:hypothetical protein ACTFIT_001926 [Dictyostelium discoideum]